MLYYVHYLPQNSYLVLLLFEFFVDIMSKSAFIDDIFMVNSLQPGKQLHDSDEVSWNPQNKLWLIYDLIYRYLHTGC